jgi:hypothetical protein
MLIAYDYLKPYNYLCNLLYGNYWSLLVSSGQTYHTKGLFYVKTSYFFITEMLDLLKKEEALLHIKAKPALVE